MDKDKPDLSVLIAGPSKKGSSSRLDVVREDLVDALKSRDWEGFVDLLDSWYEIRCAEDDKGDDEDYDDELEDEEM